eukprot:3615691-Pyramimonas_sp.AAC.1
MSEYAITRIPERPNTRTPEYPKPCQAIATAQMLPREPPRAVWNRTVAAAARTTSASLTGRLDVFLAQRANAPKTSL